MEGLKPGRIVYYVLSEQDAVEINRRRTTGASIAERMKYGDDPQLKAWPAGAQAHIGNEVSLGEIVPAMVLKVWSQDSGCSNLKVMLDGTDTYWATSRSFAADRTLGTWHWMFEGQQTRYQPDRVEVAAAKSI